jgi:lactoylglutathione lyase
MKHGSTVLAFVEDPNGYKIELLHMKTLHSDSAKNQGTVKAASH